ncbi:Trp family transcriptional regulator [Candidatus Parcubacteria bacterium]|nr:Trp family transcriptional regulator [Candidatus Parcubacteria bacterium]
MTQVSRKLLRQDVEKRMFELFWKSFEKIKNKTQVVNFLDGLLSPTEKTMLAKRITVAFLLHKGYDQRSIASLLKVSSATVSKVNFWLKSRGEGYRWVFEQIEKEEGMKELVHELSTFFADIPTKGRNWSRMRKRQWERELARRKPF